MFCCFFPADKNSLNATKNQDPRRAPSIVFCTVKKLISSYSSNKRSPKPKPMQPKVSECSPRTPQTGISKPPRVVKTQICPPLQQSHSPTRRKTRIRKVYYSEAQSQMRAGIPCAPPATPLNGKSTTSSFTSPMFIDITNSGMIPFRSLTYGEIIRYLKQMRTVTVR